MTQLPDVPRWPDGRRRRRGPRPTELEALRSASHHPAGRVVAAPSVLRDLKAAGWARRDDYVIPGTKITSSRTVITDAGREVIRAEGDTE